MINDITPFLVKREVQEDWYIRSHTVIYADAKIGKRLITGDGAQIQNCTIGNDVTIGSLAVIESGALIGNNVTIHTGAFVCDKTLICNGAWVGPNTTILNTKYPHTETSAYERQSVIIGEFAKIGCWRKSKNRWWRSFITRDYYRSSRHSGRGSRSY